MQERKFKIPDPAEALKKARKYCAYQERSQQEVRDKLYTWGLHKRDVESALAELISSGYLNEGRFAQAFAGGKFRIKKWGKIKIERMLKAKKVSEACIRGALKEIDREEYRKTIRKLVEEKAGNIREKNPMKRKYKIASSVITKGFEPEEVWEILNKLDP